MSGPALRGCGCIGGFVLLLVLCVPLLFLGVGDGGGVSAAGAVGDAGSPLVVPGGGSSCDAAVGCQAIPPQLADVPAGFFPDSFVSPPGECTSWAAALWPGHHGRGVSWGGDAWEWFANAAAQSYVVASTPSVGAIAVFRRTSSDAGAWGHVGVVLGVTGDRFRITEMNVLGRFVVDERDLSASDPSAVGFVPVPADALP
jgi:hypothetical protein